MRKSSGKGFATVGVIVYTRQFRCGLLAALAGRNGIIAVDLGDGGDESMRRLAHLGPEVLLVDLPKARLTTLLRRVHVKHTTMALLAVNCDESERELLTLFEAGLTGFVSHDAGPEGLIEAIQEVLRGEFHCPPRIAAALIRRVNGTGAPRRSDPAPTSLTQREAQVAALLERTMTNKEIAASLGIGAETVRNHVYSICRKLHAHRRSEIVAQLQDPGPALRIVRGRVGRPRQR